MSRSTSFGRRLPAAGWQRGATRRMGIRLWARPARVVATTALGALIVANALILYRLSSKADDSPTALLPGHSDQEAGGSFEDVATTLQSIQASIEARVEGIEPIDIGMAASQGKRRQTPSSDRQVASARNASGSAHAGGSSSTVADSSAGSSTGSTSDASTSGESASGDAGEATAGTGGTGGGGTTGDASNTGGSGGSAGSSGSTSGGGGGGGGDAGAGTNAGSGGGSGVGTDGGGGGGG